MQLGYSNNNDKMQHLQLTAEFQSFNLNAPFYSIQTRNAHMLNLLSHANLSSFSQRHSFTSAFHLYLYNQKLMK
jgi:hypothetical protein